MSGITQPPLSTSTPGNPDYYSELLSKISRPADWRQPSIDVPAGIQEVHHGSVAAKRLRTLLDAIASISLRVSVNDKMTALRRPA